MVAGKINEGGVQTEDEAIKCRLYIYTHYRGPEGWTPTSQATLTLHMVRLLVTSKLKTCTNPPRLFFFRKSLS